MAKTEEEGEDRRQYERVKVSQPVKLEAILRGRFIDIMRLEMSGVTIDMSRGGFLAKVDQSISPGVRCRIDLAESKEGGEPESLWGRVRRSSMSKRGFIIALEFDEPLKAMAALGGQKVSVTEGADPSDDSPSD